MTNRRSKSQPTWTDVKTKLAEFDRIGLVDLIHDLYSGYRENQTFLHTRFGLGEDILAPYKKTIKRWMTPDVYTNQDISIAKGKQAISDYKKAVGNPEGLVELMVFFCEEAAGFCADFGNDDEAYFNALLSMFEQALKLRSNLPVELQQSVLSRLQGVREISNFGYGVRDEMDFLLARYSDPQEPERS